jgi:anti-anti-sigma factor
MQLSLVSNEGGIVRIQVTGKVNQKNISPFSEPLGELLGLDAYNRNVLLDMHDVTALDSSGIGWLLVCNKRFREAGGRLVLHSLSPLARNVLKVLNMQLVFRVADNEQDAIEMFLGEGRVGEQHE